MANPWFKVPLLDYEAHMSMPQVAQAAMLAEVFADLLKAYSPRSVAVIGCAGGNGFERISPEVTTRVVGIDINPAYVGVCGARFDGRIPELELVVGDIENDEFSFAPVDLVYAALVLEYVDVAAALTHILPMLVPGGTLGTVVQLPGFTALTVTPSPFVRVQALRDIMHFVSPTALQSVAEKEGFEQARSRLVSTRAGKEFQVQTFQLRTPTNA